MSRSRQPNFLLASDSPRLIADLRPILASLGVSRDTESAFDAVQTAATTEAALQAASSTSIELILLDADLPGLDLAAFLASLTAPLAGTVILIAPTTTPDLLGYLEKGLIQDILTLHAHPIYWRLRINAVSRSRRQARQLELLRQTAAARAQSDPLTGALNRAALLSLLFRETDRSQRMGTSLSLILFDIDDFADWRGRLGNIVCDDLLLQITSRVRRLLRSYDLLGRLATERFAAVLPGCQLANAALLSERMRLEVFATPLHAAGRTLRLTACFGVAACKGRSPIVVLREAEQAVIAAQSAGPESIQCAESTAPSRVPPMTLPSSDDPLAW